MASQQGAEESGMPKEIPITQTVEFSAGGYDRVQPKCLESLVAAGPQLPQPPGKVDILDAGKAFVEAAQRVEILRTAKK